MALPALSRRFLRFGSNGADQSWATRDYTLGTSGDYLLSFYVLMPTGGGDQTWVSRNISGSVGYNIQNNVKNIQGRGLDGTKHEFDGTGTFLDGALNFVEFERAGTTLECRVNGTTLGTKLGVTGHNAAFINVGKQASFSEDVLIANLQLVANGSLVWDSPMDDDLSGKTTITDNVTGELATNGVDSSIVAAYTYNPSTELYEEDGGPDSFAVAYDISSLLVVAPTNGNEYNNLAQAARIAGYDGHVNDALFLYLGSEFGVTGTLNERLFDYLGSLGLEGTLNERLAAWNQL